MKEAFFPWIHPRADRLVKRVMPRAKISCKQATGKGSRHAFGIAMVSSPKPLPITLLAEIMGHSSTKTTEIYLRFVGEEKRKMVLDAWEDWLISIYPPHLNRQWAENESKLPRLDQQLKAKTDIWLCHSLAHSLVPGGVSGRSFLLSKCFLRYL